MSRLKAFVLQWLSPPKLSKEQAEILASIKFPCC